jgi:hypothetical protein
VYQTIEFVRLIELAKFTTAFHLERLLVDCVRHNDMQVKIFTIIWRLKTKFVDLLSLIKHTDDELTFRNKVYDINS